jgi:hypothetical protein
VAQSQSPKWLPSGRHSRVPFAPFVHVHASTRCAVHRSLPPPSRASAGDESVARASDASGTLIALSVRSSRASAGVPTRPTHEKKASESIEIEAVERIASMIVIDSRAKQ